MPELALPDRAGQGGNYVIVRTDESGYTYTAGAPGGGITNVNLSAGTTSNNLSNFVLSNSNGVSFGLNGSTITASVLAGGNINISAGTTSNNLTAFTFNNANGITFGLNASTLTASHNGLTTAAQSNQVVNSINGSTGIFTFNTGSSLSSSRNANSFTFGLASDITTALQSAGAYLTTAMLSNAATISNIRVSAGTTSNLLSAVTFANANNFSFGLDGSTITGSYTVPTVTNSSFSVQDSATTIHPVNRIAFSTGNNITATLSTGAGSATVGFSHNLAGTSTGFAGANISGSITHNSSGINLSLSVAAPGGGAGATLSHYSPEWALSGRATNSSLGNNTLYFQPFDLPFYLSASRINFYISISGALSAGNSTGTCWQRASYGLYSQDSNGASTQSIRLITSYAITHLSHSMNSNTQYAATHYIGLSNATSHSTRQTGLSTSNATTYLATNLNGGRVIAFPLNSTLTPGRYWLAFGNATTAGNAMTNGLSVQITSVGLQPEIRPLGQASAATNASVFRALPGWGSYSATTAAFPSLIALSTDNIRRGVAMTQIHFDILGFSTSTNQI